MTENDIAAEIVDASYKIHTSLGPGLLETVYEVVLQKELRERGLVVNRQVAVPIVWNGTPFHEGFRADLIVADLVIVELKSVEQLAPVHARQLLTYLRLTNKRLGLLINFGEALIKTGIKRAANNLPEDSRQEDSRQAAKTQRSTIVKALRSPPVHRVTE